MMRLPVGPLLLRRCPPPKRSYVAAKYDFVCTNELSRLRLAHYGQYHVRLPSECRVLPSEPLQSPLECRFVTTGGRDGKKRSEEGGTRGGNRLEAPRRHWWAGGTSQAHDGAVELGTRSGRVEPSKAAAELVVTLGLGYMFLSVLGAVVLVELLAVTALSGR